MQQSGQQLIFPFIRRRLPGPIHCAVVRQPRVIGCCGILCASALQTPPAPRRAWYRSRRRQQIGSSRASSDSGVGMTCLAAHRCSRLMSHRGAHSTRDPGQAVRRERSAKFMRSTSAPVETQSDCLPIVAGGRHAAVERHAHLAQRVDERLKFSTSALLARAAETTNSSGVFDLGAEVARRPELGRVEERAQHRRNVAAAREISLRHAVDERLRRIVADKADRQLARKKLRRGRPRGQEVQQLAAFLLAVVFELSAPSLFSCPARGDWG